jgi:hypothetical protein
MVPSPILPAAPPGCGGRAHERQLPCPPGGSAEAVNCFDCAGLGQTAGAVAVCADCGAGVCPDHAQVTARWLTRTAVINRTVVVEPPARTIRCRLCQQARDAAG